MPDAAVRPDVHEALDVHRDLGPQRPLDLVVALDLGTEAGDVRVGQVADPQGSADPRRLEDVQRRGAADPENVGETDLDLLVAREIDAGNTSHISPDAACAWGCACR